VSSRVTSRLVREAAARLGSAGVASPEHDAAELLAHVLGTTRPHLSLVGDVTPAQADEYDALVARRVLREPLQHLTGTAAFRYNELAVGPGVFVPRPETELLAGWGGRPGARADREWTRSGRRRPLHRLGSCRALCRHRGAEADVHAVELDDAAVEWAARNLAGSGVDLRHGDMADAFADLDRTVDVVLCNPPYIPLEAYESVEPEARDHDPQLSLFSGQDGLAALRLVETVAARLLRPGGVAGAEHADVQGESAPALFAATGRWSDVRDHEDLAGRPRFLTVRLAR